MLILEYMRKYCFLEKASVSPRHVQSSASQWNTQLISLFDYHNGRKAQENILSSWFSRQDLNFWSRSKYCTPLSNGSVRESWSYALWNKIVFSFPQFISTAAMTHTIYMGFLCISLVLVILCEASAKKGIREETQKEKKVHLKDIFSGRMKRYENTVESSFKDNQKSKYK